MALSRSSGAASTGNRNATVPDAKFRALYPTLHDFLVEREWDDGKPRKTGTVMLLVEDGWWKAWLHDRDGKGSSWFSGVDLDAVLQVVEESLDSGTVAWRPDRR